MSPLDLTKPQASLIPDSHAKLACSKCGAMQVVFGKHSCELKKVRRGPREQSQQCADAMLIQEKSFRSSKFEQRRCL